MLRKQLLSPVAASASSTPMARQPVMSGDGGEVPREISWSLSKVTRNKKTTIILKYS